MTNLTLFAGGSNASKIALKGASKMAAALRGAAQDGGGGDLPEGGVYISFSGKNGAYSIGQEKDDADPNEIWLINIFEFQGGWMCWKGGAPVAKRLASIFGEPVETPNMEEHGPFKTERGEGWSVAKAIMLRSIDRGIQGYYSTSTKSAVREFGKLEAEVARRLEEGLPAWPLIQLEKEQFKAQGQTNWKPILHVAGWLAMQQVNKLAAAESVDDALEMLEGLVEEADAMEAEGIVDATLASNSDTDTDSAEADAPEDGDDNGIEDAEIIPPSDDADEGEGEADEEVAAEEPKARTGGLARRARPAAKEEPKTAPKRRFGSK